MGDLHKSIKDFQIDNPLAELQESMKAFQMSNPLKELQESMKVLQIHNPLEEFQKTMKAFQISNPLKEIQESMKVLQMHNTLSELQETMRTFQINNPLKEFQESMKVLQIHDPLAELQVTMNAFQIHNPLKELQKALNLLHIQYPWKELQESIKSLQILKIPKAYPNIVEALSIERWQLLDDDKEEIQINNDGSVTTNSQIISQLEIQNAINQIFDNTLSSKYEHFENVIQSIYLEIRALKNSTLEKILKNLIYPLLIGLLLIFLSDITASYRNEYFKINKRQIKKHIESQFSEITNKNEILKSLRFVTASKLNMRSKPTIKSKNLCILNYGQVVELVAKKRNWSLISWRDKENSNILQGWVFTRYLEKFQ